MKLRNRIVNKKFWLLLLFVFIGGFIAIYRISSLEPSVKPIKVNSIKEITEDMALPHDAYPHGVPKSYSWSQGPDIGMGNEPGIFKALIAWGQLYEDIDGNPAKNALVELKEMETYIFSLSEQEWILLQSTSFIGGASFVEDFKNNASIPTYRKILEDGHYGVKAGNGYNFHFWPEPGRISIEKYTDDIGGVFITLEARLVLNDINGEDDIDQARYLLNVGADYWYNQEAHFDNFVSSGGVGMGRFKYVTRQWQAFNMCTASEEVLKHTPPPMK